MMDDKIKMILQLGMKESQIYDLIDKLDRFVTTMQDYELLDSDDVILDHYDIPKDTWVPDIDAEDQPNDVFSRDFFHYRIYDTIQGEMTLEELDYYLTNWRKVENKLCELFPNPEEEGWLVPDDFEVSDVIREAIKKIKESS